MSLLLITSLLLLELFLSSSSHFFDTQHHSSSDRAVALKLSITTVPVCFLFIACSKCFASIVVNSFQPTSSLPRMLSELLLLLSTKSKHRSLCCGQRLSINHPLLPAVPCSFHAFFLTLVRIAAKSFPCPCLFMLISLSPPFSPFLTLSLPFSPFTPFLPHPFSPHPFSPPTFSPPLSLLLYPSLLSLSPSFSLLSFPFLSVPPFYSLFLPLSSLFSFPISLFLFLSLLVLARPCSALLFRFSCSSFFLLSFIRFLCLFISFFIFLLSHFPFSSFSFFLFSFFLLSSVFFFCFCFLCFPFFLPF